MSARRLWWLLWIYLAVFTALWLTACSSPIEPSCDPDPVVVRDDGSLTQLRAFREAHPFASCHKVEVHTSMSGVLWVDYTCYLSCGGTS